MSDKMPHHQLSVLSSSCGGEMERRYALPNPGGGMLVNKARLARKSNSLVWESAKDLHVSSSSFPDISFSDV